MAAKDRRLYARFDIGMDEHPKVMLLSDAAFRALIESTMYARRQLTDGFLDERIVTRKWGQAVADELTSNASDRPSWVKVEGGYTIHDFAEHQVTSADIEAKREAGRAGGIARAKRLASTPVAPATEVLKQNASKPQAKTETETETETSTKDSCSTAPPPSVRFDEFWAAYPRKVGKQKAAQKFTAAAKKVGVDAVIAGAHRLATDPNLPEQQFIPHPTTWLERGGWDDEPLAPKQLSGSQQRLAEGFRLVQAAANRPSPMNEFPLSDSDWPRALEA